MSQFLLIANRVGMKDDVAISLIELPGARGRPRDDLEIFDAPDVQAGRVADDAIVPRRLGRGGVVFDLVVDVGADEFDVAVFDVVFLEVGEACVGRHGGCGCGCG